MTGTGSWKASPLPGHGARSARSQSRSPGGFSRGIGASAEVRVQSHAPRRSLHHGFQKRLPHPQRRMLRAGKATFPPGLTAEVSCPSWGTLNTSAVPTGASETTSQGVFVFRTRPGFQNLPRACLRSSHPASCLYRLSNTSRALCSLTPSPFWRRKRGLSVIQGLVQGPSGSSGRAGI